MIALGNCALALVDVQEKRFSVMHEKDALSDRLQRLVRGCLALKLPVVWMEQTPGKMGPTIPALRELLGALTPLAKSSFSCCGSPAFLQALQDAGRRQVLLAGIETHVCVYQTAAHLVRAGYAVEVVADAVSSRAAADRRVGLQKIRDAGAGVTSVETALFELLQTAEHPAFREILRIVK